MDELYMAAHVSEALHHIRSATLDVRVRNQMTENDLKDLYKAFEILEALRNGLLDSECE